MSILTINNLSHSFGEKSIFKSVDLRLLNGEHVGLIGANGFGKSTLFNLISGSLLADEGTITWSNNVKIGFLNQHINLKKGMSIINTLQESFKDLYDIESQIENIYNNLSNLTHKEMENKLNRASKLQDYLTLNGFYNIKSKINSVSTGLGLKDIGLEKAVDKLSGGQRTKLLLAKLLLEEPEILLLDEPTNYLDEEHIEWLTTFLKSYDKAFVVISHNLLFINDICDRIWHIENCKVTRYIGDYNEFVKMYEMHNLQLKSEYKKQQREIAKLEDYIRKNKARASTSKQAKSREKKLNKIDRIEIVKSNPRPYFNFKKSRDSGELVFETKDLVIGYNTPLTKPLNLKMTRGDKIAFTGANGIGKTTLLKSLMSLTRPLSGIVEKGPYQHIGYYEQEVTAINNNTVIDDVMASLRNFNKQEVRRALAQCGLTHKHIESYIKHLSGGEQSKVRLCKLINTPSNILILDEPTNHLDKDAKDELKKALIEYSGSILLVCHEPYFFNDIVNKVFDCESWQIK